MRRTCVRLLDGQAILTLRLGQQARGTWQAANADPAHACLMTFRETSIVCLRFVLPELSVVCPGFRAKSCQCDLLAVPKRAILCHDTCRGQILDAVTAV
jgi:hypothetical protein